MNILILGGTGVMGKEMVCLLKNTANTVYVTSRTPKNDDNNIKYIQGNAHDESFLNQIFQDIHCDILVDFMIYTTEEFKKKCQFLLSNTDHYFYFSSSRVYAECEGALHEDSPRLLDVSTDRAYLDTDEYALAKARQEDILKTCALRNWTIIRPYITYSDIRLQLGVLEKEGWLYRALRGKPIVFSKDVAEKWTTLTWGRDVAKCIISLFGNSEAKEKCYHITVDTPIKWKDVLQVYVDTLETVIGKRPAVLMVDSAAEMGINYPQFTYDRMFDRIFDSSEIRRVTSYKADTFVDPRVGLAKCLEEFLKGSREFRNIKIEREASFDRLCKVCANHSEYGRADYVRYLLYRFCPNNAHRIIVFLWRIKQRLHVR